MSTSNHFIRADKSDEITTEVRRESHSLSLAITVGEYDNGFFLYLTEDQLATIAEVLTEDQDTRPIECGTCEDGLVTIGYDSDTRLDQGDPIKVECPVCIGKCTVTNAYFLKALDGVWPDLTDARKMLENEDETMQLSKGGQ